MEDKESAQLEAEAARGAVCAHIGIGAGDEQAKMARDRLADVLAEYRRVLVGEQ